MPAPVTLTMIARLAPEQAKHAILSALELAGGDSSEAAIRLGVARATVLRLIILLELRAEVDRRWPLRRPHAGQGRPNKSGVSRTYTKAT